MQREEWQTEPNSMEASYCHHIAIILNSEICSEAVNHSGNSVLKSNLSLVNEVSMNNKVNSGS
jgi:hypothetical protein